MEADTWSRLSSAASRRFQARYDLYLGMDDVDGGEEEPKAEYICPFCAEDFDFVGLCCHIDDEHAVEAKSGVCPICSSRIGVDLVGHLMIQHANCFKMQRKRSVRKLPPGSHSLLSLLKKDLRDGNLLSLFGGSSHLTSTQAVASDPFLSSLIFASPESEPSKEMPPSASASSTAVGKMSDEKSLERVEPSLSASEYKERAQRCAFVQELILSAVLEHTS